MWITAILAVAIAASPTFANIIFSKVQPTCDASLTEHQGCLRGQSCLSNNTCVASYHAKVSARDTSPRSDGRCGSDFGDATCDPNGEYGGCCSQYGYCGSTPDHCLTSNGCQNGCTSPSSSTAAQTTSGAVATGTVTTDGTCGAANGGTVCGDWPQGSCCSMYGFCGSTSAHCGDGCQSGPCVQASAPDDPVSSASEPVIAPATQTASGAAATGTATTDGTCGAANGGTVCGSWPQGSCCSMYGFCGSTSAHCGEGCQSGPCVQAPAVAAPGPSPAPANANAGSFKVVGQSGVPAMHAALLPNGRVVFLDKIENYTQLQFPNGYYAYSAEYNPATNEVVPLAYKTNAFCSGGSFLANGTLLNVGGNAPLTWLDPTVGDGFQGIRYLTREADDASLNGEDWVEPGNQLDTARWYASVQTMPDGTLFVASGSLNGLDPTVADNNNPTYEILSAQGVSQGQSIFMPLLVKTQPYYMYPFIHLLNDGTLFVFASKSSEIFDVATNQVTKTFPDLPGDYRTYPNTGGSVMLPLASTNKWTADIVICGGGAYQDITSPTDASCGRISPLSTAPKWEMDSMPSGRGMVEGTLLPDGSVLWLNGANRGAQGFNLATDPTFEALIYNPDAPLGQRWTTGAATNIPRLYHSVALLLLDGTLLIAGSNPDQMPVLDSDPQGFSTEFRVEIYTPPYLSGPNAERRPTGIDLSTSKLSANAGTFTITFTAPTNAQNVKVALYHGGFVTHSLHMSHRMLFLDTSGWQAGSAAQKLSITGPPNAKVAPPGPYVVYVVVDGVPGVGQFVMVA